MQVKLVPTSEQALALAETLDTANIAANLVSGVAFEKKVFSRAGLQKLLYRQIKAQGLSAQPALHVIRKVADAYTTLHAQVDAGLLGPESSQPSRKLGRSRPRS
ncbi:hypothetical protein ACGFNU_16560 [Spirillospora sp. NPDC048911]|uniref:hypothetical protein n=1 Tax=Spirillospora sp. NPDC048911 TaxID=3364527 RepID=UPI0037132CEC